ncbi:hypothetical protein [Nocardia sp. CA-119907]|uniref:hypothetical protein n=1 Tax=Nocardia sp. CA-119907 TaxID=3239973 RepID=UPI003D98B535
MFGVVVVDVAAGVGVVLVVARGGDIGVGVGWAPQCVVDAVGVVAGGTPVLVAPVRCRDFLGRWSVEVWVAGGCAGVDEGTV